ncbi:MAG: hypothetical protein AAGE96_10905 [Cyanobacteria bacterium P01_G01_bin.19]
MLVDKVKNLTYRWDELTSEPTIPDPWQTSIPVPKVNTVMESPDRHLPEETNLLISPAGNPDAPQLACHQSAGEEIILADELKLKTSVGDRIKQQLEKALALLYWLKTADRGMVSS